MADVLREAVREFLESPYSISGWALSNLIRVYDSLPVVPELPPDPDDLGRV